MQSECEAILNKRLRLLKQTSSQTGNWKGAISRLRKVRYVFREQSKGCFYFTVDTDFKTMLKEILSPIISVSENN